MGHGPWSPGLQRHCNMVMLQMHIFSGADSAAADIQQRQKR
jgi:hypothetical protein